MRAFIRLREIVVTHKERAQKLKELELRIERHDEQIAEIFETINQLLTLPKEPRRKIGLTVEEKKMKYNV